MPPAQKAARSGEGYKMKRTVAIMLLAVMVMGLAACGGKEDLTVKQDENGVWDITGVWKYIGGENRSSFKYGDLFTFYPDGTFYDAGRDETSTYKVKGSLFVNGGTSWGMTIEGSKMTWKYGNATLEFRRVELLPEN